jgi:hypothetical protein
MVDRTVALNRVLFQIPIECVDGLYFIETSSVDSDLSNDDPWKVAQRRLGFMHLNAL